MVDATFPRSVELDLADLEFIDVGGMRGLRGLHGQRMTIVAASPPVRRLPELLGWDTDPGMSVDRVS